MLRACFLGVALLLAALIVSPVTPLIAQRVEHTVFVSALDKSGAPLPTIAPNDVVITEDKVTREVIRVVPAIEPMEVAILIDNSQAADAFIRDYRTALPAFIQALGEDETGARHQVAIITIGERPTINTDYTLDLNRAAQGVQRIFATSGSAAYLLDGLVDVSRGISKRGTAQRPVIVAISTEGPELSNQHYQSVLEPLRASGAAFHAITMGRPDNSSEDRSVVLDVGARDTGGSHQILMASSGLKVRMLQLANVLTHQFKVTYARPQSLLQPQKVTVTSAKPNITVRGTAVPASRER